MLPVWISYLAKHGAGAGEAHAVERPVIPPTAAGCGMWDVRAPTWRKSDTTLAALGDLIPAHMLLLSSMARDQLKGTNMDLPQSLRYLTWPASGKLRCG